MLEDYARRNGFPNPTHFTDDGISGTRFDRPGFTAMMEQVEAGNVEAIIVKDMSRLGRDYLKVGQVMEILRQRGVRLIAINDNVDTAKGDSDMTPFLNIMYEFYARDTSRKIKSVFKAKGMSGKHMTGTVIYGYPDGWGEAAPLTGLLYCADCGGKMYVHRVNKGKRVSQYTCSQYSKVPVGTLCKTQHRIAEKVVLSLVSDTLHAIADYAKNDRAAFIRTVQEAQVNQQDSDIKKKRRRLAAAQKRAGELERLMCKIYEDNALGRLPDARYAALDAQYAKEQEALSKEITELEKSVKGYDQGRKSAEKFIAMIDKYQDFDTMTTTMLNEFVEKILVHERDQKGRQDTGQEVEIYFNFVGKYIPPTLKEAEPTPEELEALRQKEERRERAHRAYLQRKASGAQKRYEDKIKARKKAELDAKKNAIRAEDMAKGIASCPARSRRGRHRLPPHFESMKGD